MTGESFVIYNLGDMSFSFYYLIASVCLYSNSSELAHFAKIKKPAAKRGLYQIAYFRDSESQFTMRRSERTFVVISKESFSSLELHR